jgi:hypothetical protein
MESNDKDLVKYKEQFGNCHVSLTYNIPFAKWIPANELCGHEVCCKQNELVKTIRKNQSRCQYQLAFLVDSMAEADCTTRWLGGLAVNGGSAFPSALAVAALGNGKCLIANALFGA